MAALLAGARLTEWEDDGHLAVFAHWDEVLRTLIGRPPA
jgi:hypothetical protein